MPFNFSLKDSQYVHTEVASSLYVQKPLVTKPIKKTTTAKKQAETKKISAKQYAQQKMQKSVQIAEKELSKHVVENKDKNGKGNNHSADITRYRGEDTNAAWCASFVNYVTSYSQGLGNLFGLDRTYSVNKQYYNAAKTAGIREAAKQNGVFENVKEGSKYTPKAGDLIIWDSHIGFVDHVNQDGSFTTIEGNTDDALLKRSYSSIKDATHPKCNNGEYTHNNLVGFVNMEEYYEKYYTGKLITGSKKIDINA